MRWSRWIAMLTMIVVASAGGCGQPKGVIFEPLDPPLRWPPPPQTTRIEYVGALTADRDLKPARSFLDGIGSALFGEESDRSMLSPFAMCTDERDRLFVCDSNAQVVHVFDLKKRKYEQWRPDVETPTFAQPVGVALDPNGGVLVADSVAAAIFRFDARGRYLGDIGREHLVRPCGLAYDRTTGRLFVADPGCHQVVVLGLDGALLDRIGHRGAGPGEFNFPTNVAVDSAGRLHVSDSLNFRIQVFDADLAPIRRIGRKGDLPGYFSQPKGIALDSEDHLYVVDAHFESVQIFDDSGRLLLTFGHEGHGPAEFWLPAGIHIDSSDRIWIADTYNRRVQVFDYRPEVSP